MRMLQMGMTPDEIAEAHSKKEIDTKMSSMLREMALQIMFILLVMVVINGNQDTNAFLQNQDLRNTFSANLEEVLKHFFIQHNGFVVFFPIFLMYFFNLFLLF